MTGMQVTAVGMLWFRNAAQYAEYLALFEDAHVLPKTFSRWHKLATDMYESQIRKGMVVVKAEATPDEFRAWCSANGHRFNAEGRMKFGAFKAYEKLVKSHPVYVDK
ncbi:hypothetical protein SAMN04244572_04365 [Azotobacter beijerinckii]|uniref:Uncharacterized protein n=1 Tax=Azotobacter beijerinckii TaxID=170623 RepID=A0A1H6ZIL2_9GAMM|nr:hypothetical protein [Azotobacter beijerinckii]SEJ53118.1 hypothetical protein SAMN04244572_04365 [Azotobacter beijerinckii]